MVKRVWGRKISQYIDNGSAFVKPYIGATAEEVRDFHIQPLLRRGGIDAVVLMVGTNNISKRKSWSKGCTDPVTIEQTADEVAQQIISLAEECKRHGINDVFINGIVYRKGMMVKIDTVNSILKQRCLENDFIYVDNTYMDGSYIGDGTHFNEIGNLAFTCNLASCINNYYDV